MVEKMQTKGGGWLVFGRRRCRLWLKNPQKLTAPTSLLMMTWSAMTVTQPG